MYRFIGALSLLALSTATLAQKAVKPDPAQPVSARPDPAMLNARLAAPLPADQAAMKAHVLFLASDAMKGREAREPRIRHRRAICRRAILCGRTAAGRG